MAKDVNIHVKTTGAKQAEKEITDFYSAMREADNEIAAGMKQTTRATEEATTKNTGLAKSFKDIYTAVIGPLGIGAAAVLIASGIKKIIAAFDDMKRASAEAVNELANQQRAASSFFEAINAYSGPQRRAALAQARGVQAATGLPFESSMQLLEAQQRSFGEINPQSTQQFASYWQLHAGPQTADLIRWMSESGIKTPDQQGNIMRMISAVADQSKLQEEDVIGAISSRSQRFRAMGWSPEETITNIGKAISGLSPTESSKAMRGMFEAMEGFDESKALELKAPKNIAASEQARIGWIMSRASGLPVEQRNALLRQAFGPSYPYITKMFEPTSPQLQQAISYAASPQAAAEESANAAMYRGSAEGMIERARGGAGVIGLNVSNDQQRKAAIREYGKQYLENLRANDRVAYEAIKLLYIGDEAEYEGAAATLWRRTAGKGSRDARDWGNLSLDERLTGLESGAKEVHIHYHGETVYNPVAGTAGDRDIGPRDGGREFK